MIMESGKAQNLQSMSQLKYKGRKAAVNPGTADVPVLMPRGRTISLFGREESALLSLPVRYQSHQNILWKHPLFNQISKHVMTSQIDILKLTIIVYFHFVILYFAS